VDLNNDGFRDILSGSYSRMGQPMAGLFQVLWGKAGNRFEPAAELQGTDQQPLIIPIKDSNSEMTRNICTRPTATDWNGDGKLDLVVGNFEGTFYLFQGEGSGKFAPVPQALMAANDRLRIHGAHSDPFVVDWDADGDLDLLSGSSNGGVEWAENTAGPGKLPALKPFKPIIPPSGHERETGELLDEGDLTGPSGSTRVWADDFDGDGKLDLLVGDSVTLVAMAKGVNKKQYTQKLSAWKKSFEDALQNLEKATSDTQRKKAQERYQQLYQKRSEFMNEQATGYVWFFRRK
jgi:hypothetical protein